MSLSEEASRSIQGAWGLLRRDPGAPTAFNATLDGFWRSFFAAAVLLPLELAYLAFTGPTSGTEGADSATRWMVNILVYVISWTAWPLIAFYLTRAMGCGERLIGYIVAYNWSQLLAGPFLIGIDVVARLGFAEGGFVLTLAGLVAVLFYEYLIARQMLATTPGKAAIMVFSALLLALVLRDCADFALKLTIPEAAG
jgi:hypothetical protein